MNTSRHPAAKEPPELIEVGWDVSSSTDQPEIPEREVALHLLCASMREMVVLHEWVYDTEGRKVDYRILDCNPAFCRITGIPASRAIGALASTLYGTGKAPYLEQYAAIVESGETAHFETYFPPMDKYFDISVFAIGLDKFATVTSDITEHKNLIARLGERNALLDAVLESTQHPICALSRRYCLIGFNRAFERFMQTYLGLKVEKGDCLQKYIQQHEELTMLMPSLDRALQGELVKDLVKVTERDSQATSYFDITLNPISSTGGKVSGVSLFFHDITELTEARQALEQYSASLEGEVARRTQELREAQERLFRNEKLAALGQMAGSVAHELRNPLSVILQALYLLRLTLPADDSKAREYLDIIANEVQTSNKIIQDLLDFSRTKTPERAPIPLAELAQGVLRRHPAPPNIQVHLNLPEDNLSAWADPRHAEMVLSNLVVNAYQAMPEGGSLTLSTHSLPESGEVAIAVRDTGVGISEEMKSKLFHPLFTTKSKGVGLGLVVCQKLAEANNGRIEVQSELGKGSTFTLILPGAPKQA